MGSPQLKYCNSLALIAFSKKAKYSMLLRQVGKTARAQLQLPQNLIRQVAALHQSAALHGDVATPAAGAPVEKVIPPFPWLVGKTPKTIANPKNRSTEPYNYVFDEKKQWDIKVDPEVHPCYYKFKERQRYYYEELDHNAPVYLKYGLRDKLALWFLLVIFTTQLVIDEYYKFYKKYYVDDDE